MLRTPATILFAERHNLWYSTHNPLESTYTHTLTTYKAWVVILVPELSFRTTRCLLVAMEFGPLTLEEYLGSLSPKSLRLHTLEDSVRELQTRLLSLEGAAAPGRSDSPSESDPRLLTILEESLSQSRNSSTGRLASVTALLQKNPFRDAKKQKLELWLQHATRLLETSGADRESWGTALLTAMETAPQQAVYQQLNDAAGTAGAPTDGTFCSYEQVTDVLRELFTQKETPGELLEQLQDLSITGVSPDAIGAYRDAFMRLAAGISQQLCSDEARCVIIVSKMPEPIQFGLALVEGVKQPSKLFETARELAHRLAGPCQKWWEERSATLAKGKAKQPRSESYAEAAARPSKGLRLDAAGRSSSRFAPPQRAGLPPIPGKSAEEVKALADAGLCLGCGRPGHRWGSCPDRKGQASTPHSDQLATACTLVAEPAVLPDDASLQPAADLMSDADCDQHSVMPGHVWRRLSKLTKPFDLIIGCHATGTAAASMTPDQFLTTLHEGHALIDASRCTPFAAKQLIVHAQACRKRKAFSAVYLLPASKDAIWKNLVSDAPHVARLRLTAKLHVHAHYHRIFVPELNSWPCRLAGKGAQALNDGGSQLNLLSKSWAAEQGLAVPSSSIVITLGDGTTTTASGPLTIRLTYGSFKGDITVHVMQLTQQYDIILGNAFLIQTQAVSEYDTQGLKRLVLKRGNRKFSVNRPALGMRQECLAPIMSAMQAGIAMRRKEKFFLARVTANMAQSVTMAHTSVAAAANSERIPDDRMDAIIKRYSTVLVDELPPGLPPDRGVGHIISLEQGSRPTYRPSRRLSPLELAEVESHVKKLLLNGHIEPSKSPFGANVLFVQKKDGTLRMCLDYRALNKITVHNKYPLPRIDDLIDKMSGAKCFSSLDLASGYHQIRIAEEDVPKTAFSTPFGHYQFKVLAFGLTNAPATFQYAMNDLFAAQLGRYVCVYLDDILIFSKNAEDHEKHLEEVLSILEKNKFFAKLSKCDFNRNELLYLGHIIGADGIKVDPAKIATVASWPAPRDLQQLRSFLGLTNYFRKFIQGYAARCKPLTALTCKGVEYAWTPERQAAFEGLKLDLTTAPVLKAPDFSKAFEVVTDSSQWSLGGVLLQEGQPLAYTSRKMIPAELNYTVSEQECLATVHAMKIWRCYLEGIDSDKLTLVTDHNPNVHLQDQQSLSRRQVRWIEFLQRFHFKWSYRPGRLNVADPISRRTYPEQGADPPSAHFGAMTRGQRATVDATAEPQVVTPGKSFPASMDEVTVAAFQEGYKVDADAQDMVTKGDLTAAQGLLWHGDALMVPKYDLLRQDVMYNLHDASISGHPGVRRTKKLVRRCFWWPGMDTDIGAYVQTCSTCQRNKARTHSATVPLLPLEVPSRPWQSVSMDFITSLPKTKAGKTAILVFVCRLTKMVHMCATVNECTSAIVHSFS